MQKLIVVLAVLATLNGVARAARTYVLPDITVTSLSHTTTYEYTWGGNASSVTNAVDRYVVDGGGSFSIGAYAPGDTIIETIKAPAGYQFAFSNPAPPTATNTDGDLTMLPKWRGPAAPYGTVWYQTPTTPSLTDVTGTAPPVWQYSLGEINGATVGGFAPQRVVSPGGAFDLNDWTSDFSFTSMTATMVVPSRSAGSGAGSIDLTALQFRLYFAWFVPGPRAETSAGPVLTLLPIPEPATPVLVGLCAGAACLLRRRRA